MSDEKLSEVDLLQEIANLAHWGPRYPDPECAKNAADVPGFDHANSSYRLGIIIGLLARHGVRPGELAPGRGLS